MTLLLVGSTYRDQTGVSTLSGFHVAPPSILLNAPVPAVPAYTTLVLLGSMAKEKTNGLSMPVAEETHVSPPSVVFWRSPLKPAYKIFGSVGSIISDSGKAPDPVALHVAPPFVVL